MILDFSKIQQVNTSELTENEANAYYHLVTLVQLEGIAYPEAEYETRCLYHIHDNADWTQIQDVYDYNN